MHQLDHQYGLGVLNLAKIADRARDIAGGMIELRRLIHSEPELGLQNPLTKEKILHAIDGLPVEIKHARNCTGLAIAIRGTGKGECRRILLRADTDALPLHEDNDLPFASTIPGHMHACGHDGHTAMLVGAIRLLCERRESFSGEVVCMFQPGEEGYHGARFMLEDGLLDPLPEAAFALHLLPNAPHGVFSGRSGTILASNDGFAIRIKGRGGHASMPHEALDPVPIACEIALALQSFVTRRTSAFDPAVITVTQLQASNADNVISSEASLRGTIRAVSAETRNRLCEAVQNVSRHVCLAHDAQAEVEIIEGYPPTVCDERGVRLARVAACEEFGPTAWQTMPTPMMGSEDFSYVLETLPGAFVFLGAATDGTDWACCAGLHSDRMALDERVLALGAAWYARVTTEYLNEGWPERFG